MVHMQKAVVPKWGFLSVLCHIHITAVKQGLCCAFCVALQKNLWVSLDNLQLSRGRHLAILPPPILKAISDYNFRDVWCMGQFLFCQYEKGLKNAKSC